MNKLSDPTLQAIVIEKLKTSIGEVMLCSISKRDGSEIIAHWDYLQKAKNELFGKHAIAIEIYPPQKKVVNRMNMRHLWVLPEKYKLPFGFGAHLQDMIIKEMVVKMYWDLTYVISKNLETAIGNVTLCSIENTDETEIVANWDYFQNTKNKLFGKNATAVEIYPDTSELVNERNMRHLWVLPKNYRLSFGLGAELMNIIAQDVTNGFDQIIRSHRVYKAPKAYVFKSV